MIQKDNLYEWCREQREIMSKSLTDYESGSWKIGEVLANGELQDQTQNTMSDLRNRIADLDRIIATYESSDVPAS